MQHDRLLIDSTRSTSTILESNVVVPDGSSTLVAMLGRGDGVVGSMSLMVNGEPAGSVEMPLFMRMISSVGPSIASDHGSAVSNRYEAPFPFAGTLLEVVIQLLLPRDLGARKTEAVAEMSRQ